MEGLSRKEMKITATLDFDKKYFFTSEDIDTFAKNKTERYNIIKHLLKKKRIIKLNKTKYYLIRLRSKFETWSESPIVAADEMCNGKDYMIGGWAAANYWRLTEQIPMQIDIYTTKRQGKVKVFNMRFVFHRTTTKRLQKEAVIEKIGEHTFLIQNKEVTKKWMTSRR